MTMRIVVGVDESDGAGEALRWSLGQAAVRDAELTAVLVWGWLDQHHLDHTEPFDPEYDDAAASEALAAIVAKHLRGGVPDGLRLRTISDLAGPGLVAAAADADLLVVGARGVGGFKGLLLGSVSHHCLHRAPCPVAVVKPLAEPDAGVERIVVGVDGSATSRRALDWAIDAARAHHARLQVVHAWHPALVNRTGAHVAGGVEVVEQEARKVLADAVAGADPGGEVSVEPKLVAGSAGKALLEVARGADLIVVGSRRLSAAAACSSARRVCRSPTTRTARSSSSPRSVAACPPTAPTTRSRWAIVDLAPNAILLVEADGTIVLANQEADKMFGHKPGELLGTQVDELVPPPVREVHRTHRRAYHAEPRTRPMGSGLKLHAARKDGTTFPVEIALSPLTRGDQTRVVAIVRDITDRLAAERQLEAAERELSVREDRERIARDLHDTVIQRLFAAGMSLQAVATQAEPGIGDRVGSVIDELDETIREIRQAIFQLTAHNLERASLRRQIIEVVEQQEEALGFAPEVRFDGPVESVDDERATHLLAVLREALANVARHARASRVEVHVEVGEDLTLLVSDDGVGMPAQPVAGGGTVNLRERADALGGTVEVVANEPRGTCVRWSVPAR